MASVSETIRLQGLELPVVVTNHADAAAATAQDASERPTKRVLMRTLTVGGNGVGQLIRLEVHQGKLFLDIVEDEDLANLDTLVGAMDLASTVAGHPNPTEDGVDSSALSEAGG